MENTEETPNTIRERTHIQRPTGLLTENEEMFIYFKSPKV